MPPNCFSLIGGFVMRSSLQHNFAQVPSADIPRSSFDRTHCNKTTFDAGYLVPIYVDEVLPAIALI